MAKSTEAPEVLDRFAYEKVIEEESINVADLPDEIKNKIRGLVLRKGRFIADPVKAKKAHIDANTLIKDGIVIAELIQDWIDKDLPPEPEESEVIDKLPIVVATDDTADPPTDPTPAPAPPDDPIPAPVISNDPPISPAASSEPATPPAPPAPAVPAPSTTVQQAVEIKTILDRDGRITADNLKKIIGTAFNGASTIEFQGLRMNKSFSMVYGTYYYPAKL